MRDIACDLDDVFGAIMPLERNRMVAEIERARRRAAAMAEGLQFSRKQTHEAWGEVEQLGRLLFFLRFAKCPPNATAGEMKLYGHIAAALQARRWQPVRARRARRAVLAPAG